MHTLEGSVESIVFRNEDNHYTVARFRLKEQNRLFRDNLATIVGALPGIQVGELLTVEGEWENDPRYGRQLHVTSFIQRLPASTEGMVRYLSSGLIKGIGPKKAERIVAHFGEQTLAVIEQQPDRLREVKGITAKDCTQIVSAWAEQSEIKELHLFLQSHEVSLNVATRIYKQYGNGSIKVIRENPYQLAQDVHGIGFRTADDIALKLGMPADSLPRLASGLKHVLAQAANEDGHCFLREPALLNRSADILKAPPEALALAMEQLGDDQDVFIEAAPDATSETVSVTNTDDPEAQEDASGSRIYYGPFWYAENGSARLLQRLLWAKSSLPPTSAAQWEYIFNLLKQKRNMHLAERQREAVQRAYQQKVCILTGGPGTGKSTSIRALLMLLRSRKIDVALAAPTGRAAKRLAEATGYEAKTLHRLLEYTPHDNSYQRNEKNPLPHQFVIVDEFSMVDILLFYHLLKALPRETHLLLVGDADQLPSVGPGNVLRDLLNSEAIPSVRLTELFRQAQRSKIVVSAHRINTGQTPELRSPVDSDFFFLREEDPQKAQDLILDLVQRRLPARYHFDPMSDIQVLAPMYNGLVGVRLLNEKLQQRLNSQHTASVEWGERKFAVGDKVMQMRNDYDKGVFNGDVGRIRSIDREKSELTIEFVEEAGPLFVKYEFHELDELTLAYAVTVHKSQGSEYAAVVIPLFREHSRLLQRNLLYTAITRAKRFCVLVGQPYALELAVHNDRVALRNTALAERLLALVRPDSALLHNQ
jgi:exodeoxyribonuclease V alpha subunit